ncbi:hypothetical protein PFISCL1PPCAC_25252, partial [Pristionchus fissidentatus]
GYSMPPKLVSFLTPPLSASTPRGTRRSTRNSGKKSIFDDVESEDIPDMTTDEWPEYLQDPSAPPPRKTKSTSVATTTPAPSAPPPSDALPSVKSGAAAAFVQRTTKDVVDTPLPAAAAAVAAPSTVTMDTDTAQKLLEACKDRERLTVELAQTRLKLLESMEK